MSKQDKNAFAKDAMKMNVNPKGADIDVSFRAHMDWWNLALREYMAHIGFRK